MREKHFQRMKESHSQFFMPEQVRLLPLSSASASFSLHGSLLQLEQHAKWKEEQQQMDSQTPTQETQASTQSDGTQTANSADDDEEVEVGSDFKVNGGKRQKISAAD